MTQYEFAGYALCITGTTYLMGLTMHFFLKFAFGGMWYDQFKEDIPALMLFHQILLFIALIFDLQ